MDESSNFLKSYKKGEKENTNEKASQEVNNITGNHTKQINNNMAYEEKCTFKKYENKNEPSDKYKKNNILRNLMICFFITAMLLMGIFFILPQLNKVTVPAFNGWDRNNFMLWASENEILTQIEEQYNDNIKKDIIQSQSIAKGQTIKKGDIIKVVVSKGPDLSIELKLPDIMNMTKDEIDSWTESNHMSKVRISSEYNDTVEFGKVISYEINDNTVIDTVKRNTPIYIIFSKGKLENVSAEITVPDFKSMGITESIIFAQENGLDLIIEEQYDKYIPKNNIIAQSVKKDSVLYPGDEIKITVSLGEEMFMPSFSGISKEKAVSSAANLGIDLSIKEIYSSLEKSKMIYQSIAEGTKIAEDMKLELHYSLGNKIVIGNYVGAKEFDLRQWIDNENKKDASLKLNITYTQNKAPKGTILQQDKKDTYVFTGSEIKLVVSTGKTYFVPDFVAPSKALYNSAITIKKAEKLAEDLDIILVFVQELNTDRLQGEIWYQSIQAGTEVNEGEIITLKYNPITKTVTIPDFLGKTRDEIKQMDEFYALDVAFDYETLAGKAYSQSIKEGAVVPYGTKINLKISPY